MSKIKSVLLVCTGNSCRSVMAEGLLKKKLQSLGKNNVEVRSAGLRALNGMPPTAETIQVMKEEDVDVSYFKSKNLSDEAIKNSDLILVMEKVHKNEIIRRVPEAAPKVHILREFGHPDAGEYVGVSDVPDPIGRPIKDYKYCLAMIKTEIERITKLL